MLQPTTLTRLLIVMFSVFVPRCGRIRSVWPTSNALIASWICVGLLGSIVIVRSAFRVRELRALTLLLVLPKSLPDDALFDPSVSW